VGVLKNLTKEKKKKGCWSTVTAEVGKENFGKSSGAKKIITGKRTVERRGN